MTPYALVAQLDRVTGYEPVGRGFESLPAHHKRHCFVRNNAFYFYQQKAGRDSNPFAKKAPLELFLNAHLRESLLKNIKEKTPEWVSFFWWANRDSNPGPTGYEPVALTN